MANGQSQSSNTSAQSMSNNINASQFFPIPLNATSAPFMQVPTSIPSSTSSDSNQRQSESSQTSSRPVHLRPPMPAPPTMPTVMPMPMIPSPFMSAPPELLPVDPYLPCHSRHFLTRRNQPNIPNQVYITFVL